MSRHKSAASAPIAQVRPATAKPKTANTAKAANATAAPAPAPAPKTLKPKSEDPASYQAGLEDASPLLLTVERAALKLGICRDFMYRLLAGPHPKVRSVKIGRSRRVPVSELEAYIARRLSEVA